MTQEALTSAPEARQRPVRWVSGRRALVLLCASGVSFMIMLDSNIVAVSLPSIARNLNATFADIEWVVSAYVLRVGFRGRVATPRNEVSGATEGPQKLRKRAAKRPKSLASANLCVAAERSQPYSRPRLSPGPASASALPTSSPKSSIEVCSRTERSSPFACRSACSAERATLTVTFDSTSGCR